MNKLVNISNNNRDYSWVLVITFALLMSISNNKTFTNTNTNLFMTLAGVCGGEGDPPTRRVHFF